MTFLLRVLEVTLGVGLVIFVHELGHFLAAKLVGIRVERFSLGFPPRLLGFRWGDTDYCLSAIPLGGYVKMVGEIPEEGEPDDPGSFQTKTVEQRALVISAGVIMNVIFAVVGFLIAFKIGIAMNVPVVGGTLHGSPADGVLERGDRIVMIDGEAPLDFLDVAFSAAFADEEGLALTVERDGETRTIQVRPRRDLGQKIQRLGIAPIEEVAATEAGSPAEAAGLRPGDRILGIVGLQELQIPVPLQNRTLDDALDQAGRWMAALQELPEVYALELEPSASGADPETLTVRAALKPDTRSASAIAGALGALRTADAQASKDGAVGAYTVETRPAPIRSQQSILLALQHAGKTEVRLEIWRDGQTVELPLTPGAEKITDFGVHTSSAPVVLGVMDGEPAAKAGLRPGDVIRTIDGHEARIGTVVARIKGKARAGAASIQLTIERQGEKKTLDIQPHRRAEGAVIGASFGTGVVSSVDTDSPAAAAGLAAGAVLLEADGQRLRFNRESLRALATGLAEGKAVRFAWRDAKGTRFEADLKPAAVPGETRGSVGASFRMATFEAQAPGLVAPIRLGFDRTWLFMKQVFLTLQGMFTNKIASSTLGGPITIASQAYEMTSRGISTLLYFLCVISINLAVLNILPIPVLDGGHLVFLLVERLKGSPVSPRIQGIAQTVGLVLILLLILFVTKNDIARLISA